MDFKRIFFRSWYYFRIGHGSYLLYLMNFAQWITILYVLLIERISFMEILFPSILTFLIIFIIIYVPMAGILGYVHFKRSPMFSSEVTVSAEANPYNYMCIPGKERRVYLPMYRLLLKGLDEEKLSDAERKELENTLKAIEKLEKGEKVSV